MIDFFINLWIIASVIVIAWGICSLLNRKKQEAKESIDQPQETPRKARSVLEQHVKEMQHKFETTEQERTRAEHWNHIDYYRGWDAGWDAGHKAGLKEGHYDVQYWADMENRFSGAHNHYQDAMRFLIEATRPLKKPTPKYPSGMVGFPGDGSVVFKDDFNKPKEAIQNIGWSRKNPDSVQHIPHFTLKLTKEQGEAIRQWEKDKKTSGIYLWAECSDGKHRMISLSTTKDDLHNIPLTEHLSTPDENQHHTIPE